MSVRGLAHFRFEAHPISGGVLRGMRSKVGVVLRRRPDRELPRLTWRLNIN
jgi:hypothetical protein